MSRLCLSLFAIVLAFFLLGAEPVFAQEKAYGAYGHYPTGNTRVLAMGGAFVGLADDAGAVVSNPAGLSLSKYRVDLTGGENRVVNREVYIGDSNEKAGIPYTSTFRAASLRLGPVGIGAGYSVPYAFDYNFGGNDQNHKMMKVESYDAALSIGFFKKFAIGATVHAEKVRLAYQSADGSLFEETKDGVYPRIGILFQPDRRSGFGITYTPERRYDFDETRDDNVMGFFEWFHDVVIPAKITLGGMASMGTKLRWVGDIDIYQPVKDAIYVGGTAYDPNDAIIERQQTVVHGGFEYTVIDNKKIEFIWRGGGYTEPKRFERGESRFHFTMGVEFRMGPIVLAGAYDQAPDFSNVSQSVSISFGEL